MEQLLLQLCSSYMLSGGIQACNKVMPIAYQHSGAFYSTIEDESKYIEKQANFLYESLPYNKPIGALAYIGYDIYKNDYKIPVSSHINLEYNGKYSCNLHWEF
jgi:hypothetical protein